MKRARNGVARVSAAWRSSWTSVSSASRATSRTSSVSTGSTGSSKWTRLSAPSGSDTSSVPARRSSSPSAGAAVYSGRIPIAIGLPAYPASAAPRAGGTCASGTRRSPIWSASRSPSCSTTA